MRYTTTLLHQCAAMQLAMCCQGVSYHFLTSSKANGKIKEIFTVRSRHLLESTHWIGGNYKYALPPLHKLPIIFEVPIFKIAFSVELSLFCNLN